MLLVLDIGNTNITAGVWDENVLRAQWRFSSQRERTSDELGALLKTSFDLANLTFAQISGVAICSVVPPLTPVAAESSTRYFKIAPLVVDKSRSEERRVGKECVQPCRSRWSPYH